MGDAVGAGIEFGVGERLGLEDDGGGARSTRGLRLEELVDAVLAVIVGAGVVPAGQDLGALGGRHDGQVLRRLAGIGGGRFREHRQPLGQQRCGGGVETGGVVDHLGPAVGEGDGQGGAGDRRQRAGDERDVGDAQGSEAGIAGGEVTGEAEASGGAGELGLEGVGGLREAALGHEPDRYPGGEQPGLGEIGEGGGAPGEVEGGLAADPRRPGRDGGGQAVAAGKRERQARERRRGGRGAGLGQLGRIERAQPAEPMALEGRGAGDRLGQGGRLGRLEQRQMIADGGHALGADREPVEIGEPGEHDRRGAGRDDEPVLGRFEHAARDGARRMFRQGRATDQQQPAAGRDLRASQRVPVIPMIEAAHQRHQILGIEPEIEPRPGTRPGVAGKIAPQMQILGETRRIAGLEACDERREALDRGGVAARVEGERGILERHVEPALREDVALVDAAFHQMPADPVLALAVQDGPDRRIQAGIAWQRAIVEVDRPRAARAISASGITARLAMLNSQS